MSNKVKAAISYAGIYFTGILFLIIEKEDEFIRKSAAQSFILGLFAVLTHNYLLFLPMIGRSITTIFDILFLGLLVFLIIKALNNIYFKLQFIGDISEKYIIHWFK